MQAVTRALRALARGIMRLWRYWMADIGKRKSFVGKLASIGIGLFAICCLCSVGLGVTRSAGQAVGLVATTTPSPIPTATSPPTRTLPPTITPTLAPTNTPAPTTTPEPTPTPGPQVVTLSRDREIALRTGPGTGYPTLHVIAQRELTILAARNEHGTPWYHVKVGSLDGWTILYDLDPAIVARIPVDTSEIAPPTTPTPRPTETSEPLPDVGVRVGAICRDGTRSSATGRGACSHHGGVAQWIYR